MSEIKALEELRRTVAEINMRGWTDENDVVTVYMSKYERRTLENAADEIEAEIAERYMLLPVDADGEPIHVGDAITLPNGSRDDVRFITIREHDMVFNERGWVPNQCTHAKPRTLEDVLNDVATVGVCYQNRDDIRAKKLEKYADEIRELLGTDDGYA